mmetsp:Transcript_83995/g.133117  ORF Transcript_83995/g.133117 Transcript_83995/m.133117 type:complete len:206 (+) Transcript_83995:228-845(+)
MRSGLWCELHAQEHPAPERPLGVTLQQVILHWVGVDPHSIHNLQLHHQNPELALHPSTKLVVHIFRLGQDLDHKEVLELLEEGERCIDITPISLVALHVLHYLEAPFELLQEDPLGALRDVVGGIHRWEGRRDHRHHMLSVRRVRLWVPHLEGRHAWNRGRIFQNVAECHGARPVPLPLVVQSEEPVHQLIWRIVGIQLADPSNQ